MSSEITSPSENAIRFSRILNLKHLVALGSSISVGVGIFVLTGVFIRLAGRQSLIVPYLVMALAALPIVLTYSERLAVLPGSGGAYNLARTSNRVWLLYTVGWLMLGGFLTLIGVLGWGIALYLNLLFTQFFDFSFDLPLLATIVIALLALYNILGTPSSGISRSMYVYGAIIVLAIIILRNLLLPGTYSQTSYFLYSTINITTISTLMMSGLWGLLFILNVRDEMHRPTRTLFKSMLLTLVMTAVLGILAGWAIMRYSGFPSTLTPLVEIITNGGLLPAGIAVVIYAGAGLLISLIAINQAFIHYLRLTDVMIRDGFLPDRLQLISEKYPTPVISLAIAAIVSILLINWIEIVIIVGLAAVFFLWIAAATHLPEAFQSKPNLPKKRFPKLPFHPLFPWLTIAVGIFMPFSLGNMIWIHALGWIVIGTILYLVYARKGGMATFIRETVISEDEVIYSELQNRYVVMVGVSNPKTAESLFKAAARLSEARNGVLLVLKVLVTPEQMPPNLRQQIARKEWESLVELLSRNEALSSVEVKPIVRLAPSPADGILAAVSEAGVNLLLLGWEGKHLTDEMPLNATLDPVLRRAQCEVAILHGVLPQTTKRILVPTAGGPYAPVALSLAQDLSQHDAERQINVETLVTGHITPEVETQSRKNIQSTLDIAGENGANINQLVLEANTIKEGIIAQARKNDLVLLGVARRGFPERPFFGGLPAEVATKQTTPTILTRGADTKSHRISRVWELLADALPTLTLARQEEVYQSMRLAAQPNVDFFVLITLSAIIATLGLLQGSGAVIIGAMLVAPLMSPILAIAMSMVHGNLRLLIVATEATTKGAVLAIMVGVGVVLVSPIDTATAEIVSRTQPNILDLMVALASGAAAGYAISRKEVAAALPGVAIAAALVPPLCVVGYGIGTSQLDMASGALLLFITNLVAIIFAAAGTFLALGFHPARTETGELVRGLKVTLISLGIILVILVFSTVATVVNSNQKAMVEEIFTSDMVSRAADVRELSIERTKEGFIITATIIDIEGNRLSDNELSKVEQELSDALDGEPVIIDAMIIPGVRSELNENFATIRQIQDQFRAELAQHEAEAITVEVKQNNNGYNLDTAVIALGNKPITQTDMANIQQSITESVGVPISIRATFIPGNQINVIAPAPTPTP